MSSRKNLRKQKDNQTLGSTRRTKKSEDVKPKRKARTTKKDDSKGPNTSQVYTGSIPASSLKIEQKYEVPEVNYNVPATMLIEILQGTSKTFSSHDALETFFTKMKQYEDYSVLNEPEDTEEDEIDDQIKPDFKEKIVKALFWIPVISSVTGKARKRGEYKYLRIRIAPSNIKKAGMGAYAVDPIPKGARGVYKGVSREEEDTNVFYAWVVKSFNRKSGLPDENDESTYYIDAQDIRRSNWTRFVNCGMTDASNNFESDQIYDKFFYVALRNIEPDEELFIDYGPEYRESNLGMKGKY